MQKFFEKSDSQIQTDVMNELKWDASVTQSQINVTSKNGIVTLRGHVPHYFEKARAENAAQRISGVRAIADEIEVKLLADYERSDEDIAEAAINALKWNYQVPKGILIKVEKSWVSLSGEVEWDYQREAAGNCVSQLMGVTGVFNMISLRAHVQPLDVKTRIESALRRAAQHDGENIQVLVNGTHVTLSGRVNSQTEIAEAKLAAWNAPGVSMVTSHLELRH